MLDKKQLQDQVSAQISDDLFYRHFNRALNEKMGRLQEESAKTYAEKVNRMDYTVTPEREKPTRFKVPGDD